MNCIVTHENNLVADGRLGKFYKYVNNKINGSNGIGSHKSPSGEMLYSDRDKAVLLNDYFSSVFTIDNGVIDTTKLPHKVDLKLLTDGDLDDVVHSILFTPSMVVKYNKRLKNNGSPGPDGIPTEFYKVTAKLISFPLSVIYNLSLQFGNLPALWKCASITTVFKKGSPSDHANYRPIPLTCIACKILPCVPKKTVVPNFGDNFVKS